VRSIEKGSYSRGSTGAGLGLINDTFPAAGCSLYSNGNGFAVILMSLLTHIGGNLLSNLL